MPHRITMRFALSVTRSRSFEAPVVISPKISSSAVRPPRVIASLSISSPRDARPRSSLGNETVRPPAWPRPMIVTLCTSSVCSR